MAIPAPFTFSMLRVTGMCRSIKTLRTPEGPPTDEEIEAAALQFVRKVSGYRIPSTANRAVFDQAVADVTAASRRLLDGLVVGARVAKSA
jgi:hypothetical protein